MDKVLFIKNMVCDRCKSVVRDSIQSLGIRVAEVELGRVVLGTELSNSQAKEVELLLQKQGFELLQDKRQVIIESIKKLVIEEVNELHGNKPKAKNFSDYLSEKIGYDYSYLSQIFSVNFGTTIEQYIIAQRIEKAKEWLSYDELSVTEIAWRLGYSSVSHLSNQFKKLTGVTPAQFRTSDEVKRKSLDQVGFRIS